MIDVCCCGQLGDKIGKIIRTITVDRIETKNGKFIKDTFPIREWSKNESSYFMKLSSGTLVVVRGRMEVDEEVGPLIVVEQLTPLTLFTQTKK